MYQALYRKYRPQTFSDVVGQQGVTDTLRSQLETGRLSHAYLFTGTRGTGKTSCAKILAKAVNCENLQDGNPCNACPSCRAIDSGGCMDVLEIDAASNNGVDSVRVLRDDAVYTPAEVKMRVYIIDEVHMLSTAAFNALLKIIEEPPEHLLFILATTELHKVPATILSRCQRFAFRRLTPEDIAGRLNFIAYQEGIEAEPEAIRMLARLADGGMRDGVSLLDQCASASTGPLTAEGVCRALGLAGEKKTAELMDAIAAQDAARALTLFSGLYANGMDAGALLDEMSALCRDLLILQSAPKSGLAMLSGIATEQQAMDLRGKFAPGELLRMLNLLQETRRGFSRNADGRIGMELCLMQLCQPKLTLDLQTVNARLSKLEEQLASGAFTVKAAAKPADADDEERPPFPDDADDPFAGQPVQDAPEDAPKAEQPNATEPVGFWPELARQIQAGLSVRERSFFNPDGPIQAVLRGDVLLLAADTEFVLGMVKKPAIEQLVREKAAAVLGRAVQVRFVLKTQLGSSGADPLDRLVAFGKEHSDIFTIK